MNFGGPLQRGTRLWERPCGLPGQRVNIEITDEAMTSETTPRAPAGRERLGRDMAAGPGTDP